jgi:hypothetical protein
VLLAAAGVRLLVVGRFVMTAMMMVTVAMALLRRLLTRRRLRRGRRRWARRLDFGEVVEQRVFGHDTSSHRA